MNGHHLILGELVDFISGETIPDTHDERYRQKLARILIESKGYLASEIRNRCDLLVRAGEKSAIVKVDFAVFIEEKICMIVKYGPGSLVTRHRSALAASRLLTSYQIPVAVVTNGEDADILDGQTGEVILKELFNIPDRSYFSAHFSEYGFEPVSEKRAEIESRIIYVYEVDGTCPCDDTICRISE